MCLLPISTILFLVQVRRFLTFDQRDAGDKPKHELKKRLRPLYPAGVALVFLTNCWLAIFTPSSELMK